jgi:hypothetical protein
MYVHLYIQQGTYFAISNTKLFLWRRVAPYVLLPMEYNHIPKVNSCPNGENHLAGHPGDRGPTIWLSVIS